MVNTMYWKDSAQREPTMDQQRFCFEQGKSHKEKTYLALEANPAASILLPFFISSLE